MLLKYTYLYPGTDVRVPRTYTCGQMVCIRFQNNLNNYIVGVQTTHDVRMDTQSLSVFASKTILMIQNILKQILRQSSCHKIYLIYFNNVVHVNILADEVQRLYFYIFIALLISNIDMTRNMYKTFIFITHILYYHTHYFTNSLTVTYDNSLNYTFIRPAVISFCISHSLLPLSILKRPLSPHAVFQELTHNQ